MIAEITDSGSGANVTLSAFYRDTWFTCEGARMKANRLKKQGIPDLSNWRFITLTVEDRSRSPMQNYVRGKARLRRFTHKWRSVLGLVPDSFIGPLNVDQKRLRWFWKLEMHEDGYPHWHILIDYTKRIPLEFFDEVASWWGLGRVNIGRVRSKEMHYVFKYVCKGGESIPAWILDFKGRIRCVQASQTFFTGERRQTGEKKEPVKSMVPRSLRELLKWDSRKGILVETTATGKRLVSVVRIQNNFAALLLGRAQMAMHTKRAMPSPSSITLGQDQVIGIKYEHRKSSGLGCIPPIQRQSHHRGGIDRGRAYASWRDCVEAC